MDLPRIIQDGLDAMIATWPLARAVARTGQLGMVSGTLLPVVTARRLQDGDRDGHLRRAFEHFPFAGIARRVWETFFRPGGRAPGEPYPPILQPHLEQGPVLTELAVLAGFAEVFLASEGHKGPVGIHFAAKARLPMLPTLYGALMAQPAWVSLRDPDAGVLEAVKRLCAGQPASIEAILGPTPPGGAVRCCFDPAGFLAQTPPRLPMPALLIRGDEPETLARLADGCEEVQGVACPMPGGDALAARQALAPLRHAARPFWLSGLPPEPESLPRALESGAQGLLVGLPFLYCEESELAADWKRVVVERVEQAPARLAVDFHSTPVGYELPILHIEGTAAEETVFRRRDRFCDVGFLRQVCRTPEGTLTYRCPGEHLAAWQHKGGSPEAAEAQRCFCNGLLAALGLGQVRSGGYMERPLLPAAKDLRALRRFCRPGARHFTAAEVVARFLQALPHQPGQAARRTVVPAEGSVPSDVDQA